MTGSIELQPDNGPRSSLGIGPGSDDAVGSRREFARKFVEGIGKLAGNMKGDHWEKTGGLAARMSEATGLCGTPEGEDEGGQASSSLAISTRWISTAELLQSNLATLARGREENL
ncbi:hypothetical protein B296_00043405 [Ensete ventricosum]|uniref:Uncharacterized protein n=1 Tax=Ensete ventricosum TaxID=4639 RepID=A0A426XTY6_ENSVE|nr:hypothetical protein B296_00043405 [Ensete ventricosum]